MEEMLYQPRGIRSTSLIRNTRSLLIRELSEDAVRVIAEDKMLHVNEWCAKKMNKSFYHDLIDSSTQLKQRDVLRKKTPLKMNYKVLTFQLTANATIL